MTGKESNTAADQSAIPSEFEGAIDLVRAADQIKEAASGFGADVVGIARADAWDEFVPEGYRPYDLLPEAKAVVVVGASGPTAGAWRSPNPRVMEVLGLDFANDRAIAALTGFIEQTYRHYAIQAPGLSVSGHQPPFSYMLAAVLAGLGTRSSISIGRINGVL